MEGRFELISRGVKEGCGVRGSSSMSGMEGLTVGVVSWWDEELEEVEVEFVGLAESTGFVFLCA